MLGGDPRLFKPSILHPGASLDSFHASTWDVVGLVESRHSLLQLSPSAIASEYHYSLDISNYPRPSRSSISYTCLSMRARLCTLRPPAASFRPPSFLCHTDPAEAFRVSL